MANTSLALGSSLNLRRINKSVSGLSQSVSKAQSSAAGISKSLLDSNRNKRKSLSLSSTLFRRRREATLRREREDILEAGSVVGAVRRTGKVVMSSTKGFLGRILDYLGTVLIGWAVLNLPKIIDLAQSLIGRMQKYFGILNDFVSGVTQNLLQFGQKVGEVITNISTFSFNSVKDIFDDTVGKLKDSFTKMEVETYKLIRRVTGSLSQFLNYLGYDIGDFKIPGLDALIEKLEKGGGEETPSTEPETTGGGNGQQQGGGSAGGGTRSSNPLLQLISGAEGGYDSMYPSEKYPQMLNMTMTELVAFQKLKLRDGRASAAVGAYQFLYPEEYVTLAGLTMNDKFTPENQDKLALAFLKARGVTVEAFKRDRVGTALKLAKGFAGVPVLAPVYSSFAGRVVKRGESFYEGYKGNRATVSADIVEKSIDRLIGPKPGPKPEPKLEPEPANRQARAQLESILPNRRNLYESSTMASAEGSNNILIINKTRNVTKPVPIPLGGGVIMASRKYSVNSRMDQAISNLA